MSPDVAPGPSRGSVARSWSVLLVDQERRFAPVRELTIEWEPISWLFENDPAEDDPFDEPNRFTHRLLRVMQAVRAVEGDEAARQLYWQYGAVLHHDRVAGTG